MLRQKCSDRKGIANCKKEESKEKIESMFGI